MRKKKARSRNKPIYYQTPIKRYNVIKIEIGKGTKTPQSTNNLHYAIGLIPELALALPPRVAPARLLAPPREGGLPALPKFLAPEDRLRAPRLDDPARPRVPPRAGFLTLVEEYVLLLDAVVVCEFLTRKRKLS